MKIKTEIVNTQSKKEHISPKSFKEALKKLGIEDYADQICNSNSHGELFHLWDYIALARIIKDKDKQFFRLLFITCVEFAEKNWSRPESCFQHMPRLLADMAKAATK